MDEQGLFSILDSVDSSNNYAMAKVHAGLAKHGMAWFAQEQTAGKGQRGRVWQTGKGENIALSIALEPHPLPIRDQFQLSAAVALACVDLLSVHAGTKMSIKWPNDIYWGDKKAGGILIENVIQGNQWSWAIAGIGLNINQTAFDPQLINPVSLTQITGRSHDTITLARELQQHVLNRVSTLENGFEPMLKEYNDHLYKVNSQVKLRKGAIVFDAVIESVTSLGNLRLVGDQYPEYNFGEISLVL